MTTDYIAAATAVAEAAPAETAAPEAKPDSSPVAPVVSETSPGVAAPAEPAAKPAEPDRVTKSLADVAAGKAELRKQREALDAEYAPYKELAAAKKSGSAMAVLAAAGISWKDAAREVLEGGAGPAAQKEAVEEDSPLKKEVAELRAKIAQRESAETRDRVMGEVKTLVKDNAKFRHIAGLEMETEVLSYIERYHAQTGELPGSNLAESLEIAAEAVETHLTKEAARWSKVLPPSAQAATPPVKAAVPAAEATSQQAKTLTNTTGSGPKTAPVASKKPKTPEEYRQAALDALTAQ